MLSVIYFYDKPFYYLTEPRFMTPKGMATLKGVASVGRYDTLILIKYDNGEYQEMLISDIVKYCKEEGIEIREERFKHTPKPDYKPALYAD